MEKQSKSQGTIQKLVLLNPDHLVIWQYNLIIATAMYDCNTMQGKNNNKFMSILNTAVKLTRRELKIDIANKTGVAVLQLPETVLKYVNEGLDTVKNQAIQKYQSI